MDPIFTALYKDLIMAAVLGAIGGLGLGLLQEKGLEMPHWYKETGVNFADLGFIADVLIGALAAIITYAINTPSGLLQLVSAALTAGIGGSAILKGYIKGTAVREQASRADKYMQAATDALTGTDVSARLKELKKTDQLVIRRWGPR